jgi:chromosome partitioning protein
MFHVKRGLWASILRLFGVGSKNKAADSQPTHRPVTQADHRQSSEGPAAELAEPNRESRPGEPSAVADEAKPLAERSAGAASTPDASGVNDEQLRPKASAAADNATATGGDASSSEDVPTGGGDAEPREEQPDSVNPGADDDADAAREQHASSERPADEGGVVPVPMTVGSAALVAAVESDEATSPDANDGDVTDDDSAPAGRAVEPAGRDESAAVEDDRQSPAPMGEGDDAPSAGTPAGAAEEDSAAPSVAGELTGTDEDVSRDDSNSALEVEESPLHDGQDGVPVPDDRLGIEIGRGDGLGEDIGGEDRAEVAVSGWAAHEWRLEWKAAMDEREEEVFHVKPPEDADAAASFSIDDEDTPLARELASLTARRRALDDVSLDLSGHRTRVLTISNQKGGVGKTTTSVNIAAALADLGARVLVIDLDPQGNASTALNVPHNADTPSVYDVLIDEFPLADIIQVSPESPNLLCAPSTIHLAGAEIELVSQVAREHRLRTALDDYLASSEERLDFVLIDCPPSLGLLTINAFTAAQEVLLPIQCEYYALEGLSQLLATVRMIQKHLNPELRLSTILLTMYDGRTRLSQQVAEEVRAHFPNEVLNSVIPRSVRVSEAPSFGQTVIAYDGQSAGAVAYREAAVEIVARGESGLLAGSDAEAALGEAVGEESIDEAEPAVAENEHVLSEGGA